MQEITLWELEHKAHILIDGIRIDDDVALASGAGVSVKEGTFHRLGSGKIPFSFTTESGLVYTLRREQGSAYTLRLDRDANNFFVTHNDDILFSDVSFPKRPSYYDKKTSDGELMKSVATVAMGGCVTVWYSGVCSFKQQNKGCLFCGIRPQKGDLTLKNPIQIAETVKAAFDEGVGRRVDFSGGVIGERDEIDYYQTAISKIKSALEIDEINAAACIAAPSDLSNIDRLYDAGFRVLTMNMEIWDENIFKTICPGKHSLIGRKQWLAALEYATRVFGFGNVRCNFVTGLEPKFSTLEGARVLASMGVVPNPNIFDAVSGTPLEGTRCPTVEWNLDLQEKVAEICIDAGLTIEQVTNVHPYTNALFHDFMRMKSGVLHG